MLSRLLGLLKKHYVLLMILVVAAIFRIYRIADYMTFLGDEGRDVLIVRQILHGDLVFLGPRASAADFYLGPIYYYFMAPFLFLSGYHPVGPAILVALVGIATVYLVYKIGKEFFGTYAGLAAASVYAISPLVIAYSRSSWNPNIMPFFSLLTLYTAYKGLEKNKLVLFVLSGIFLGIAMQLHYLSTFLGAILFFYILISGIFSRGFLPKSLAAVIKNLLAVGAGFVLGFSPFLLFEIKNSFPNTRTILNFIFSSGNIKSGGNSFTIISDVFFRMFSRLITFFPPPEALPETLSPGLMIWNYGTIILGVSALGFSLYVLISKIKQREKNIAKYLFLPLWFSLGVILFGLYKKPIYDYYFGFMFPAPFLLIGFLLSFLWEKGKALKAFSLIILAILIFVNLQGYPFKYPPNRQYEQVKSISKSILEKAGDRPFNFALITGGNSDHGYRYIFEIEGHPPVTILNMEADPDRKSVTDHLFVVCETACQPLGHSLWEIAGFGRAEIAEEWEVSVVKVYKLVHYEEEDPQITKTR